MTEHDELVARFSTPREQLTLEARQKVEAMAAWMEGLVAEGRFAAPHPLLDDNTPIGLDDRNGYRPFPTGRVSLDDIRRAWPVTGRLSDQEILAMQRYASPDGALINAALRTGDEAALAAMELMLRNLVSALNKIPNYRGPVVRGVHVRPSELGRYLDQYQPGTTVREPGFTTASQQATSTGNVRIYIESMQGKDISPVVAGHHQVAFTAGENFKVVSRAFDPLARVWKIHLLDIGR